MDIQKIIQSVTSAQIQNAQDKAKAHFELAIGPVGQMNMIAFD